MQGSHCHESPHCADKIQDTLDASDASHEGGGLSDLEDLVRFSVRLQERCQGGTEGRLLGLEAVPLQRALMGLGNRQRGQLAWT